MSTQKLFIAMVIFAFASVISFFQINSYWSDTHNFNTWWYVIGGVTGLIAVYFLYRVSKQAGGRRDE